MKHSYAVLEKLARSSLRLSKGVMILGGVVLLLVGSTYWLLQRLVDENHDSVRFHFTRLMENIQEQELFLVSLRQRSLQGDLLGGDIPQMQVFEPAAEEAIFRGQENVFSMPFNARVNVQATDPKDLALIQGLGAQLSSYYSAFWSTSHYQSPRAFLFNRRGEFDLVVPARGERSATERDQDALSKVLDTIRARSPQANDTEVEWRSYGPAGNTGTGARLLAYTTIDLPAEYRRIKSAGTQATAAVMLDLVQANDFQRTMDWVVYDKLTLVTPSGQILKGVSSPDPALQEGFNLNTDGLVFKLVNHQGAPWVAVYTLGYKSFSRYALGSLITLGAGFLCLIGLGWAVTRWYRRRVIQPADQARARIAESEAFSRAVIDTAPTGLCAVRLPDHHVVLENQRAKSWRGTVGSLASLDHLPDSAGANEHHLEVAGRHLQVGFVSTRYQGEEVRLYAFNDVTRHIEDARELEEARREAATANEAKTLFLATMSHEIRTPLYGVLGTLELLQLTPLTARQQDYLDTIQRSSATLFQLISDVLDVSKIESGQMALEPVEFCLLEMIEDTLRTYAAFAERKGLLLYGCADPALPDRVFGDPMRIRQVLNNLLSNAIKFTDRGRVVLRTRVLDSSDDQVTLEWQVADTGVGLSEAQQARLFELFYQVREVSNEGGAGLGLPICKWLCEMMGGQLKVVSDPGLGSSFVMRLSLPVAGRGLSVPATPGADRLAVFVRAPVEELAQHYCDWLARLGLNPRPLPAVSSAMSPGAVLVDVLPDDRAPSWPGRRICCHAAAAAGEAKGDLDASMFDVREIARAVRQLSRGDEGRADERPATLSADLHLNVLVAEDNPINQGIVREQLEALGCRVVVADHGQQALRLWQPGEFDLVLTDVNMPFMNGYELARALREQDADLPIIGVTANAMREEGARCLEVGMNAWLVKPLTLKILRAELVKLGLGFAHDAVRDSHPEAVAAEDGEDGDGKDGDGKDGESPISLPPAMRGIFVQTMEADILAIRDAWDQGDLAKAGQFLHRISGALAAVRAATLSGRCSQAEIQLATEGFSESLHQEVGQLLSDIDKLTKALG